MILADKIIMLRKKLGLSQEELADKLGVSRQSISKWEGALSTPDLNKIIALSKIFGISTDFLLKDDIEITSEGILAEDADDYPPRRKVTMEMATDYLKKSEENSKKISLGVLLCVLSPVTLIALAGVADAYTSVSEELCAAIGMVVLLVMIAIAVFLFVRAGQRVSEYEFLENEQITTEYGVTGLVSERKSAFKNHYDIYNLVGVLMCVVGAIPLIASSFFGNDLLVVCALCLLLAMVAVAAKLFVRVGVVQGTFMRLLEEGEYSEKYKNESENGVISAVTTSYWMIAVAGYLVWSFVADAWKISWIVFAVAGVLFPVVYAITRAIVRSKESK